MDSTLFQTIVGFRQRVRESVKQLVFSFGPLAMLIGRIRAAQVKARYKGYHRRYAAADRPSHGDVRGLLEARSRAVLKRLRASSTPPRILFFGTYYDQGMSGMVQGLGAVGDVTLFHKADGSYGYVDSKEGLSFTIREANCRRIQEYLEAAAGKGRGFDVVIGQMWGGYMRSDFLARIREKFDVLVVNICLDDRHAFDRVRKAGVTVGTRLLSPAIDMVLTATPEAVDWHVAEGCPAYFFPEASSTEIFHPMPELGKRYDVTFVGSCYGVRELLVRALDDAGIRVTARGSGWPGGRLRHEDTPAFFAQSRIILGVGTIGHCDDFVGLKLRDFDAPMSGSFYLTTYNADLEPLFRLGEEIETYGTIKECIEKCRYYLDHPEEREQIARRGRRRALADHTWRDRFQGMMKVLCGETDCIVPPTTASRSLPMDFKSMVRLR